MIKKLVSHLGEYKAASIKTPLFAALEAIMDVLLPTIMAFIIDQGIEKGDMNAIIRYGLLTFLVAAIALVLGVVLALLLFLTGVVFCYFAVYSLAVDFFLVAGDSLATPMLSIDKYVSFLFGFLVPFGVAFQLPVVLYLTTRVGLTTPDMLRSKRKYVILAIFVLAAILTPPDVVSQVALGLPMCGLYEIGILVSRCTKARERA